MRSDPGYQDYLAANGLSYGPIRNPIFGNTHNRTLLAGEWNGPLASTPTVYLANTAMSMLDDFAGTFRRDGRPFFLTCQFWAPHGPYLPSPEYIGRHDRSLLREWLNFRDDHRDKPAAIRRFRRDFYQALPADWDGWREIVGLAYDYTALVDEQIGRLLSHAAGLGLLDHRPPASTDPGGQVVGIGLPVAGVISQAQQTLSRLV